MNNEFTHEFHEQGNGFPCVGDDVIVNHDDCGHYNLARVASTSPIHTKQWNANYIYVTLEDSPTDWDELSSEKQDELYDSLHHVSAIREESEAE
jgi:hypothetical protein